jgi:hypothetical protein
MSTASAGAYVLWQGEKHGSLAERVFVTATINAILQRIVHQQRGENCRIKQNEPLLLQFEIFAVKIRNTTDF